MANSGAGGSVGSEVIKVKQKAVGDGLGVCYPNPTSSETIIPYRLKDGCRSASIEVREIATGRKLLTVDLKTDQQEGEQVVNLRDLSNGLYIYTLTLDGAPVESKLLSVSGK